MARDEAIYNPNQAEAVTYPGGPIVGSPGIPRNISLGPSFFQGFSKLNARWVFGIPFVSFNYTNTLVQTSLFLQNVDKTKVEALELGNEPDLYTDRAKALVGQPADYVEKWQQYTKQLSDDLSLPHPSAPWQGLVLARAIGHGNLTVSKIFLNHIDSNHTLKSVSAHYYSHTNSTGELSEDTLLNHNFVKQDLEQYHADIQWLKNNNHNLDFVLGETGRYPVDRNQWPASIADGNFGTALWTVDMMLHAMTINVTRINMQLGISMSYAAWHPIHAGKWKRAVRGPFYAHVFIADTIGRSSDTRVSELPGASAKHHSAYAIYNSGTLQRIAIVNMERYLTPSSESDPPTTAQRPHRTYQLNLPNDVNRATVHKLSAPNTEALSGITYGGKQWLIGNEGKESDADIDDTVTKSPKNGSVLVDVQASQAVLVKLHRKGDGDTGNATVTRQRREL